MMGHRFGLASATKIFRYPFIGQDGSANPLGWQGTNGLLWSSSTLPNSTAQAPGGMAYGAGKFVFVGYYTATDNPLIWTSTLGVTWAAAGSVSPSANFRVVDVAFGNGVFVATGYDPANSQLTVATSTDGSTWTNRTSGISFRSNVSPTSIRFINGKFFITGLDSSSGDPVLASSTDGISWTNVGLPSVPPSIPPVMFPASAIAYCNGIYAVLALRSGTPYLFTSADGSSWTRTTPFGTAHDYTMMAASSSLFVVADSLGNVRSSTDAVTWSTVTLPSGLTTLYGVKFGYAKWFAYGVGSSGTYLAISTLGATWTQQYFPDANTPSSNSNSLLLLGFRR